MTIGPTNAYSSENNCNNYTNNGTYTPDLDPVWAGMSLVGSGANYTYSQTYVFGFLCYGRNFDSNGNDTSNNSAGQGWAYLSLLSTPQANSFPTVYRVNGCSDPEMIWGPSATAVGTSPLMSGFAASEGVMIDNCKNFH